MTQARILNVEDDSPARFLKSRILERAGFSVVEAESAAAALRNAHDDTLQLVLLDLRLPDGDGFQVCEAIKAARPKLPVVMITSTFCTSQARHDGLGSGADAYLIEPVPAERLVNIVRHYLDPASATDIDVESWVVTDHSGTILEISGPAHRLLNLSARGAVGRSLPAFFAQDRHQILNGIMRAVEGQFIQRESVLRPRDRKPFAVHVEMCRESPGDVPEPRIRWTLEPLPATRN